MAERRVGARNLSRGTDLATAVESADSLWAKFMGLMGRPALEPGAGLWLPDSNGIHMMFMRFAIDAVFLDRDLVVVGVEPSLAPWRTAGRRGAKAVVELASGECERRGIELGDALTLAA